MPKFIFITGGVLSSLGKGIAAASIGALLEASGLKVTIQKLDPYINVDPGTLSPFSTERFLSLTTGQRQTSTSGITKGSPISAHRSQTILRPEESTTTLFQRSGEVTTSGILYRSSLTSQMK